MILWILSCVLAACWSSYLLDDPVNTVLCSDSLMIFTLIRLSCEYCLVFWQPNDLHTYQIILWILSCVLAACWSSYLLDDPVNTVLCSGSLLIFIFTRWSCEYCLVFWQPNDLHTYQIILWILSCVLAACWSSYLLDDPVNTVLCSGSLMIFILIRWSCEYCLVFWQPVDLHTH